MYRILILSCLWHFSLSEQNLVNDSSLNSELYFEEDNVPLDRSERARTRFEKPVECKKLHGTDDTGFVAIILNKLSGRLLGMGSIIDEKHILTANRAVHNVERKNLRVLLGYFKAWWGRHSYVHYVEKVLKHEHDLVILRLSKMIVFSRTIKPIRLLRLQDAESAAFKVNYAQRKAHEPEKNVTAFLTSTESAATEEAGNGTSPDKEGSGDKNEHGVTEGSLDKSNKTVAEGNVTNADMKINSTGENKENKSETNHEEEDENENGEEHYDEEDEGHEDLEGKDVEQGKPKVYLTKNRKKTKTKRSEEIKFRSDFQTTFPKIQKVLLVGFPVSHFAVIGDPISQTLVYGMREEEITKNGTTKECAKIYEDKPALDPEDPDIPNRYFCTDGTSKFCWGCVGGPTLFKKEHEYIQTGIVGGADCEKGNETYIHIRVDIHMKWIAANSLVVPKP